MAQLFNAEVMSQLIPIEVSYSNIMNLVHKYRQRAQDITGKLAIIVNSVIEYKHLYKTAPVLKDVEVPELPSLSTEHGTYEVTYMKTIPPGFFIIISVERGLDLFESEEDSAETE